MGEEKNQNQEKKEWTAPDLEIIDIESKTLATTTGSGGDGTQSYS